jgi:hypothetical protein
MKKQCRDCFAIRYRRHREKKAAAEGRAIRQRRDVPAGSKYCPRCERVLPVDSFGRNRSARDGLTSYCKPCHNTAEVDAMIEAQGGTCAVCPGKPEHVDHDHETGLVRGVLCFFAALSVTITEVEPPTDVVFEIVGPLHAA